MGQSDLINEIVARVAAKMAALEQTPEEAPKEDLRPGLLILTQEHGEVCHTVFDNPRLAQRYRIGCALAQDHQVDLTDYEVVVLFGLDNTALSKLATGNCDTPFTGLASRAILTGKRIYAPVEQIELFRYANTAPKPYYAMLEEKLALLTASGLVITKMDDLEECILQEQTDCRRNTEACVHQSEPREAAKEFRLAKRVITERDLVEAGNARASVVHIPAKCIVTDLAKDYAHGRNISLIRESK